MNADSTSRGFTQPLTANDPRLPQFAMSPVESCLDRRDALAARSADTVGDDDDERLADTLTKFEPT